MASLKCSFCDCDLTKDMINAAMCFNCGNQITNNILNSDLAKQVYSGNDIEEIEQYIIRDNYIYCSYCGNLLEPSVLETSLCPICDEYFVLDDIKQEIKDRIAVQVDEIKKLKDEEEKKAASEKAAKEELFLQKTQAAKEKLERISKFMTTGYSFDGYSIIEYKSVLSGESVIGTGFLSEISMSFNDFFGTESNVFSKKLNTAKEAAVTRLKLNALEIGANAIIGVDFDYITFGNNTLGVIANGTAVVIESKQ